MFRIEWIYSQFNRNFHFNNFINSQMPFDIYIFFWHFIWMPNEREPLNRRKKEEKNTTTHPIRIENGIHEYESLVFCFSLEFFRSFIRSIFISFYADRRPIASCEMWNIFLTMTVFKSYFVIFVFFVRSFCFFSLLHLVHLKREKEEEIFRLNDSASNTWNDL